MIRDYKDKDTAGQHSPLATPTAHTAHTGGYHELYQVLSIGHACLFFQLRFSIHAQYAHYCSARDLIKTPCYHKPNNDGDFNDFNDCLSHFSSRLRELIISYLNKV